MSGLAAPVRRAHALPPARPDGVQVIRRAAAVLRCVSEETAGLTVMEIARRLGLPRSTAHRIVEALRSEGFVHRDPAGHVVIGQTVSRLAYVVRSEAERELRW